MLLLFNFIIILLINFIIIAKLDRHLSFDFMININWLFHNSHIRFYTNFFNKNKAKILIFLFIKAKSRYHKGLHLKNQNKEESLKS